MSRETKEPYSPQLAELRGFRMELRRGPSGLKDKPARYKLVAHIPAGKMLCQLDAQLLDEEQLKSVCLQLEPALLKSINKLRLQ